VHTGFVSDPRIHQISTPAEYQVRRSMKIDAMIHILKHHLATDNRPPLRWVETNSADSKVVRDAGGKWVERSDLLGRSPPEGGRPDKIVIFANFSSQHSLIQAVSTV
jgi:hypothetical protein